MATTRKECPRYGYDKADFYSRWSGKREDWACTCGKCTDVPELPYAGFSDMPRFEGIRHITDKVT